MSRILTESGEEPPSLLGIARLANTDEARSATATVLKLLSVFGAAMNDQQQMKS